MNSDEQSIKARLSVWWMTERTMNGSEREREREEGVKERAGARERGQREAEKKRCWRSLRLA